MGFFGIFKSKKAISEQKEIEVQKQQITKLTKSLHQQKIEYLKQKLERLKQKTEEQMLEDQILDAEDDLYGEDEAPQTEIQKTLTEPSEDGIFNNLLSLGVQAMVNRNAQKAPNSNPPTANTKKRYSDEEIAAIIANTPKDVISQIKGLPEPMLRNIINNKYPDADEDSMQRTILVIKNQ